MMPIRLETLCSKADDATFQKVAVLETPSAQHHPFEAAELCDVDHAPTEP